MLIWLLIVTNCYITEGTTLNLECKANVGGTYFTERECKKHGQCISVRLNTDRISI